MPASPLVVVLDRNLRERAGMTSRRARGATALVDRLRAADLGELLKRLDRGLSFGDAKSAISTCAEALADTMSRTIRTQASPFMLSLRPHAICIHP